MRGRTFSLATDPCLADHAIDGTPLVPFALAVGELLSAAGASALDAFVIELPLLLRRNRAKAVTVVHDGRCVALADGNGVVHARAHAAGSPPPPASAGPTCTSRECPHRRPGAHPSDPPPALSPVFACRGMALGRSLYGSLFFHGPSFQVDWVLRSARAGELVACLGGADPAGPAFSRYDWNVAFPALLADLALQAAGLHLALAEHRFGVPEACDRVAGFGTGTGAGTGLGPHTVRVSCRQGARDLLVADDAGRPALVLTGLRFRPVERPMPAGVLAQLAQIERHGGGGGGFE